MTSERAKAYGRVMNMLRDLGASKLHEDEQDRIREAADSLLFCESYEDCSTVFEDVEALASHLVESGRWSQGQADALISELAGCGPVAAVTET